ncbi:hypothetical protein D3C87_1902490 [compost metagenome]
MAFHQLLGRRTQLPGAGGRDEDCLVGPGIAAGQHRIHHVERRPALGVELAECGEVENSGQHCEVPLSNFAQNGIVKVLYAIATLLLIF